MAKVASGEPIDVGQLAELVAGSDGTNTVFLKVGEDGSLSVVGLPTALGQAAAAASVPVVLASDTEFVKAEDAAHVSGDKGIPSWGVRNDANVTFGADGDYGPIRIAPRGNVVIAPETADVSADGSSTGVGVLNNSANANKIIAIQSMLYNGSTRDFQRGNTDTTVLASAARTATPTKVDQTNYNGRSLVVVINVTAASATPSVVFTIQGKAPLGGYYTILASAAITGVGTTVLRVSPHYAAASPNLIAIDTVPRTWAVDAVHADADSITYSVEALWIV